MKLTGRTILITGGSAGIGLAFALKISRTRKSSHRDWSQGVGAQEIPAASHHPERRCGSPAQIAALAMRVKAEYPKLDVLMNNGGIMLHKNLRIPAADLDPLMAEVNINVGGVIRMTSAFIDILTANKGTVINTSSLFAFVPMPSAPIYIATKAAVHAYTQSLRVPVGRSRRGGDRPDAAGSEDGSDDRDATGRGRRSDKHRRLDQVVICRFPGR